MDSSSIRNIPPGITAALKVASRATGADFDYLLKTAARESAFNSGAKAKSSSASGLFQFIEQTWLGTLKSSGGQHGLGKLSAMIQQNRSGKFHVADPAKRKALLALRFDPKLSALMAGEFTRANQSAIRQRIGRSPTDGELYIGHFMGAGNASKLINLAAKSPNAAADAHFPPAAKANKSIFYDKAGRARSVAAVYRNLTRHYSNQIAAFTPQAPSSNVGQTAESAKTTAQQPLRPLTHALFTLWRTPGNGVAAAGGASTFHNLFLPGQGGADAAAPAAPGQLRAAGAITSAADETRVRPPDPYVPSAEAFLSAFGAKADAAAAPQAPETRTAAGKINGAWGENNRSAGLLARRPGAIWR